MTVAEWVLLQEQYNADHAQRQDEEEDIAQEVFDNGIRVNANIHYNRRDEDNRSTDSTEAGGGLHRVVTHISKPVGVLLNPETRDDPARLERSKQHLNRLTTQETLRDMQIQMRQVLTGQHRNHNSLLEKTGRIRPNPLQTYPHSDNKAPESVYQAAVTALA